MWRDSCAGTRNDPDRTPLERFVRARLAAGATALDVNAGAAGGATQLVTAAHHLRQIARTATLVLDAGDPWALTQALPGVGGPVVANAVVLGDPSEPALTAAG